MGRGFTLTLKMMNEEQAKETLPIIQAAALYEEDFDDNNTLTQSALDAVAQAIAEGKDTSSLSVANFVLCKNSISMSCNPCFDECEGGAFVDAIKTLATVRPDFDFEYESLYEDTIADIRYEEKAFLKNGKFHYSYSGRVDIDEAEAYEIDGEYKDGEWTIKDIEIFSGFCPECGYPIECEAGEEVECICGKVFTYEELLEKSEDFDED